MIGYAASNDCSLPIHGYSQRSATIGSTVVARRTGTYDATSATANIATAATRMGTVMSMGSVKGPLA